MTRSVRRFLAWAAMTILGAHLLAFLAVRALPDRSIGVLGFQVGQEAARSAFDERHRPRSYPETLLGLFRGDLGKTLDSVPVAQELAGAIAASAPRLLLVVLLVIQRKVIQQNLGLTVK